MKVKWESEKFSGAKVALICENDVLTYRRDNKPWIPFPNLWDFSGGGRDGDETPEQCAIRETREEFSLKIDAQRIVWKRRYASWNAADVPTYFMVAYLTVAEVATIDFGDEGQYWQMMSIQDFLLHKEAVPQLQTRLSEYISEVS